MIKNYSENYQNKTIFIKLILKVDKTWKNFRVAFRNKLIEIVITFIMIRYIINAQFISCHNYLQFQKIRIGIWMKHSRSGIYSLVVRAAFSIDDLIIPVIASIKRIERGSNKNKPSPWQRRHVP